MAQPVTQQLHPTGAGTQRLPNGPPQALGPVGFPVQQLGNAVQQEPTQLRCADRCWVPNRTVRHGVSTYYLGIRVFGTQQGVDLPCWVRLRQGAETGDASTDPPCHAAAPGLPGRRRVGQPEPGSAQAGTRTSMSRRADIGHGRVRTSDVTPKHPDVRLGGHGADIQGGHQADMAADIQG
jgi:hypothetical protein